jgi:hypothetical protein
MDLRNTFKEGNKIYNEDDCPVVRPQKFCFGRGLTGIVKDVINNL